MTAAPGEGRPWCARPWFAPAVGIAVLVFTRLRASVGPYVALNHWLHAHGVPAEVLVLDSWLLLLLGTLVGARLADRAPLAALGLRAPIAPAFAFGSIAGLPMLVQAALASDRLEFGSAVLRGLLLAPLIEEMLFRGLLTVIPVRLAGAPFWPTAIVAGFLFGAVHVPWTGELDAGDAPTFLITAVGGVWYAWIVRSWGWNLWTTVALHIAMNAAWMLFAVDGGAVGGPWSNVGRGLTIVLGTLLTLRRRRAAASVTA